MTENIYTAIVAIMNSVGYIKKIKVGALNYSYAGEAALIAAIRPEMVDNNVIMTVHKINSTIRETYQTSNGKNMNSTYITGTIRFTHAPSGTSIDVESVGEGSDVGDKSSPKALTGMYKYALRQTFCIETGDDPDNFASEQQERNTKQQAQPAKKTLVEAATELGGVVKNTMSLETAENMVDSKKRRYGDMTVDELAGYSIGIGKLIAKNGLTAEKKDEYKMKQDSIGVILASRNEVK